MLFRELSICRRRGCVYRSDRIAGIASELSRISIVSYGSSGEIVGSAPAMPLIDSVLIEDAISSIRQLKMNHSLDLSLIDDRTPGGTY